MSTLVSIILYGLAVFSSCMIGFGSGKSKGKPVDRETETGLTAATVALVLFFGLAVALQVTS